MPKTPKKKHPNRDQDIRVRVTASEKAEIARKGKQAGLGISAFMRGTALASGRGPIEDADRRSERIKILDRLLQEMNRIGNNLNQLARIANQTGEVRKEEQLTHTLDELLKTVDTIWKMR